MRKFIVKVHETRFIVKVPRPEYLKLQRLYWLGHFMSNSNRRFDNIFERFCTLNGSLKLKWENLIKDNLTNLMSEIVKQNNEIEGF